MVRFAKESAPGDVGCADPDVARFYIGVAQFTYTQVGTGGPSQLLTGTMSSPDLPGSP
jgi:hypothetical protein